MFGQKWTALTLTLLASTTLAAPLPPPPDEWLTPAERSAFKSTPRFDETMTFCRRLADKSPRIHVTSFGVSPLGRDLPLLIVSKDGKASPATAHDDGRIVLFVQNAIHAGECDGKDGALMLLRDIALDRIDAALLERVVLLIIPIFNVDGHERFGPYNRINQNGPEQMGWRTTSRNLNLNRDYMKADAVEMRAWLKLWNNWKPDLHVDTHTTDGGDWQYDLMLGGETNSNVPSPIVEWMQSVMGTALHDRLREDGHEPVAYFDLLDGQNPAKGVASQAYEPRYSTGYVPLRNRPSILVESHMLKSNRTRVLAQYHVLLRVLELASANAGALRTASARADAEDLARGESDTAPQPFVLSLKPSETPTPFTLKGVSYSVIPSEISGSDRIVYDNTKPKDIETSWFKTLVVDQTVIPPAAYAIPPQWTEVIELVEAHGLQTRRLTEPLTTEVEGYRLREVKFAERPFEGRFRTQFRAESYSETQSLPTGTAVVPVAQVGGKIAMHLLEPAAPDSLVAWGFFTGIFEQKEYADGYKLENLAEKMLAENPALKAEFNAKLAADEKFAGDRRARLNFFYQRSPYWDTQLGLYPVVRLNNPARKDNGSGRR
jgi:hypothetical protein